MIFAHTLPLLLNGQKTQTRRICKRDEVFGDGGAIYKRLSRSTLRALYAVGKTYAVQPGRGQSAVARIRITGIRIEAIKDICDADVLLEGFATYAAFAAVWQKMHGAENIPVWVLTFKLVDDKTATQNKKEHGE
jgi:hypothetical protein